MAISLCDPILGEPEKTALCSVIDSQWLTMGDRVVDFEKAFAHLHAAEDAVAVNSCTAGLHLVLTALGISRGDEVLIPSETFVATVNAVLYVGATPVFVDIIESTTPHICPEDAQKKCTSKTKAVIVMHYGGYLVNLPEWRQLADRHRLYLIEDAAHAPATGDVGRWSDAAVFSFFSNKNMTTAEGGMVLAKKTSVLSRVRSLRSHGMTTLTLDRHRGHAHTYDVTMLGYNYRMDELRAAIGMVQLGRLLQWNHERRKHSRFYRDAVKKQLPDCRIPFTASHETAAHLMPVLLPPGLEKATIMNALRRHGIQSSIHYPPVHLFEYYRRHFYDAKLPKTEAFSDRVLSLPLHPSLTPEKISHIVNILAEQIKNER
jgi:dTDP-4-amino-4,6-dideoxygalactose transaminase